MVGEQRGAGPSRSDLARSIEADRAKILQTYERYLDASHSPLARDPVSREQIIANADQILTDVIESVRAGEVRVDEDNLMLAREIGLSRATRGTHPRESLHAAIVFFEIALIGIAPYLSPSEEALQVFANAALALNRSLTSRIQEAATSYTGYLLDKVREAHVDERRHLARELHDRVGQELSVAHRQLELFEIFRATEPIKSANHVTTAQTFIREAVDNLRGVTTELRMAESVATLEKALLGYLENTSVEGVTVRLRISGDATWIPQAVQNESFLILREAISNALTHGNPQRILIGVDLAPHELRAWVEDDGCGFDVDQPSGGVGLSSMQERVAMLGGIVLVSARPIRGTRVELYIPLQGRPADASTG